jgi:hypothetical protein
VLGLQIAAKLAGVVGLLLLSAGVAPSAVQADRSPPTAPRIVGPRTTSSIKPVYSFSATDRQTARSKLRYRCSFDTLRLHACTARFSQKLGRGRHKLRVKAVDRAGNQSRMTSLTVDVTKTQAGGSEKGKGKGKGRPQPPPPPPPPPPLSTSCTRSLAAGGGSLASFVASLAPGQTGCLTGSFAGSLTIGNSGFTLRSADGQRASIAGNVTIQDSADGVRLQGLNLSGGSGFSLAYIHGDNVTLSDLDISGGDVRNCLLLGAGAEGSPGLSADDLLIERSRIHGCGNDSHEHAVYAEFTNRLVIRDSHLYANGGYGIHFYPSAQNSLVEYTLVDGNARGSGWSSNVTFSGEAPGGEYSQAHGSRYNVIRYSLISFSAQNYNVESYFPSGSLPPIGNEVASSCLYGAPRGNFDGSNGYAQHDNRAVDPLYANRSAYDFRLRSGSPCAGWGPR